MRALKILVVVMGVLIVCGTAVLIAAVIVRSHRAPVATAGNSSPPIRVDLPAGAHVLSSELAGDRVLVRVALTRGGEELLLFEARTGARVAVIELQSPPVSSAAKP